MPSRGMRSTSGRWLPSRRSTPASGSSRPSAIYSRGRVALQAEPVVRHQVFDLPEVRYQVTEYPLLSRRLPQLPPPDPGALPRLGAERADGARVARLDQCAGRPVSLIRAPNPAFSPSAMAASLQYWGHQPESRQSTAVVSATVSSDWHRRAPSRDCPRG